MVTSPKLEQRLCHRVRGDTLRNLGLRLHSSSTTYDAAVADISVSGIGLIAQFDVPPGKPVTLHAGPLELVAEVRHAQRLADGTWLLGCSFPRPITVDEIMILGR